VPLDRQIEAYDSVKRWREGLARQWGEDVLAEDPDKLVALSGFCSHVGQDPDELLAFCFLRKRDTGERFASVKRRREVAARLREYREASSHTGMAATKLVNDVLSFLIHGGVLIHPGMIKGGG
jgi:hypothetical protein